MKYYETTKKFKQLSFGVALKNTDVCFKIVLDFLLERRLPVCKVIRAS